MSTYKVVLAGREFEVVQDSDGKFIIPESLRGIGSALKPAAEIWWLIRKPLSEKTVAANVLRWGCGGLNIDASRIGSPQNTKTKFASNADAKHTMGKFEDWNGEYHEQNQGRFPANLLFSHNPDCVTWDLGASEDDKILQCTPGCAVSLLDRQSGTLKSGAHKEKHSRNALGGNENTHGKMQGVTGPIVESSVGGASRFFYCAKASKRDKNGGLEGMPENEVHRYSETGQGPTSQQTPRKLVLEANSHPTVKSTTLMAYLIRLVTPPGGLVLDPFAGSGSTGVSAVKEGFAFIGIEKEQEYYDIASKRIEKAS